MSTLTGRQGSVQGSEQAKQTKLKEEHEESLVVMPGHATRGHQGMSPGAARVCHQGPPGHAAQTFQVTLHFFFVIVFFVFVLPCMIQDHCTTNLTLQVQSSKGLNFEYQLLAKGLSIQDQFAFKHRHSVQTR